MSDRIVDAARRYIELGMAVYPADQDKSPLIRGWNRHAAARDPEQAAEYFREFPNAQLGIACGPSDLSVIDLDPRNGSDASFRSLCNAIGLETFDGCPDAATPSGGQHLYFRAPTNPPPSASNALGPGIDVIGATGGVLAPPSLRGQGEYAWRTPDGDLPSFDDMPVLPPAIIARLRSGALERITKTFGDRVAPRIAQGERNVTLMRMAARLRWRFNLSEAEIRAALYALNERCDPNLSEAEVNMIAKSIANRPAAEIDPVKWLGEWLPHLSGAREVRVAGALAALADFSIGPLTPSGQTLEQKSGLRREKYYIGRSALEDRGAIRVVERGKMAPIIELIPFSAAIRSDSAKAAVSVEVAA